MRQCQKKAAQKEHKETHATQVIERLLLTTEGNRNRNKRGRINQKMMLQWILMTAYACLAASPLSPSRTPDAQPCGCSQPSPLHLRSPAEPSTITSCGAADSAAASACCCLFAFQDGQAHCTAPIVNRKCRCCGSALGSSYRIVSVADVSAAPAAFRAAADAKPPAAGAWAFT